MIEYRKGDILQAGCEAIVNTVNTEGVMGKGLALQFKRAYPQMFDAYAKVCEKKEIRIGVCHVWEDSEDATPRYIINFPTKDQWRKPSSNLYVVMGLSGLEDVIKRHKIMSIAIPALGCQNGGLAWENVKIMLEEFEKTKINANGAEAVKVVVYEPLD